MGSTAFLPYAARDYDSIWFAGMTGKIRRHSYRATWPKVIEATNNS